MSPWVASKIDLSAPARKTPTSYEIVSRARKFNSQERLRTDQASQDFCDAHFVGFLGFYIRKERTLFMSHYGFQSLIESSLDRRQTTVPLADLEVSKINSNQEMGSSAKTIVRVDHIEKFTASQPAVDLTPYADPHIQDRTEKANYNIRKKK
jgi:hypothetical protein